MIFKIVELCGVGAVGSILIWNIINFFAGTVSFKDFIECVLVYLSFWSVIAFIACGVYKIVNA